MKFFKIKIRRKNIFYNLTLFLSISFFCFFFIEIGYRLLDPFPFFIADEINHTEHGNLSMYDEMLGWKGVSIGNSRFVTENNSILLFHNKAGFRDIEHLDENKNKPALVFLGDSFAWGYEVEFDEMFVNRLRDKLPYFEIFNLSHRGYGTDQELLTFLDWHEERLLKFVILMFYENDIGDNNSSICWDKPKPYYQLTGNELVLAGVPVPKVKNWQYPKYSKQTFIPCKSKLKRFFLRSHFFHDILFRYYLIKSDKKFDRVAKDADTDLTVTSYILAKLKTEVEKRGAKLIVFFIPAKGEIVGWYNYPPYQIKMSNLCQELNITCFDLGPVFKKIWLRTYYKGDGGSHWNSRGHEIAAKAIYRRLKDGC